MVELKDYDECELQENVVEEVKRTEIESEVLCSAFVSKMMKLMKEYLSCNYSLKGRDYTTGRLRLQPLSEDERKELNAKKMELSKEMRHVVADMLPFIDETNRLQFICRIREWKWAIGWPYVKDVLEELGASSSLTDLNK